MSFQEVSSKIIREAINAAVYIDDKVLLPFEPKDESLIDQSALFVSFRKNSCYLDFNRYAANQPQEYGLLLNNKDLLILDWHLSSTESDLSATFRILETAINTLCLHFCVIYTEQQEESLSEKVVLNVASYFSGLTKRVVADGFREYQDFVDATGLGEEEKQKFTDSLKALTTELFFELNNKERSKTICGEVVGLIKKIVQIGEFNTFLNGLDLPEVGFKEQLVCLSFILNQCYVPEVGQKYRRSLSPDRYTICINSLYIKVFSKQAIADKDLYDEFTKSLANESNIFLTLLGLEIRNRFRETSGFIGKELDGLIDLAFFHHRKSHYEGNEPLFNEFLKEIWKDQVASFLMEKEIELFDTIDEFKTDKGIDEKLATFNKSDEACRLALAKLNLVYNRLAIKRKENDEIRFGDVFLLNLDNGEEIYLLCLTPLCDCLRPEKIKNMFFFVEGTDIGSAKGVEKSDGDYISYIETKDKKLTCIDWTNTTDDCKPFTFYIERNQMQGESKTISISYKGNQREAIYLCTLKENYAQRIANKAFFYPLRVGIDFATFKTDH